jgi:hypothetical protein
LLNAFRCCLSAVRISIFSYRWPEENGVLSIKETGRNQGLLSAHHILGKPLIFSPGKEWVKALP